MLVLTAKEQQILDQSFSEITGLPTLLLMENAAFALCTHIRLLISRHRPTRIIFLAGLGNNGGDAYAAARFLNTFAKEVALEIYELAPEVQRSPDAEINRVACRNLGLSIKSLDHLVALSKEIGLPNAMYVDALFGTGYVIRKPRLLSPERFANYQLLLDLKQCFEAEETAGRPRPVVIAIDMPSGLETDTGRADAFVIPAKYTLTIGHMKPVFYLEPGRTMSGTVQLIELPTPPAAMAKINTHAMSQVVEDRATVKAFMPPADPLAHKGKKGSAGIIGGDAGMDGAGVLNALAAENMGAGRVYAQLSTQGVAAVLTTNPRVILWERPYEQSQEEALADFKILVSDLHKVEHQALLIGSGLRLDGNLQAILKAAIASVPNLILDASALTLISQNLKYYVDLFYARRINNLPLPVITPHVGEFNRLYAAAMDLIKNLPKWEKALPGVFASSFGKHLDLPSKIMAVGRLLNVNILYKDALSIMLEWTAPKKATLHYLPFGRHILARGGSGDILAGTIVGLAAQGVKLTEAAMLGAYLCGEAATMFSFKVGSKGFSLVSQLEFITRVYNDLEQSL